MVLRRSRTPILETPTAMNKDIIINLIVMAIGFAIFGVVLYATMMLYDWLSIPTEGYIW